MQEIERKFLLEDSEAFKKEAFRSTKIVQGYLNSDPERTVRLRIRDEKAYITIKGKSKQNGLSRFEWEKEIPLEEGEELIRLCEPGTISKTRYEVRSGDHIVEIDEFSGENEGLLLAEVELNSVDEDFERPQWLGQEVTGQLEYYNSYLSKNPYKNWKK